jgi:CheY-like chemotaxis protein
MALSRKPPIILIVDDEPEMLDLLHRLLGTVTQHIEIVAVASGAAALTVIATCAVALVLTDYHMPEMNGIQLADAIKAASPMTRVTIVSVDDRDALAREAKASAADSFLSRPFGLAALKQLISETVPMPESDDS